MKINDIMVANDVIMAAVGGKAVARLVGDQVVYGTARSVGDDRGCTLHGERDTVDNAYLRVTTIGGMDVYWPLRELIDDLRKGAFSPDCKR